MVMEGSVYFVWRRKYKKLVYNQMIWKVEKGNATYFLKDKWLGNTPLYKKYPRLYSISNDKRRFIQ